MDVPSGGNRRSLVRPLHLVGLSYTSAMQIFGKRVSKWWLLLLVSFLLLSSPLLLILFFAGNNLAGAIIGPPAIWNHPWHSPPRQDLIGRYTESERHWDRPKGGSEAVLELRSDGSMHVSSLPVDGVTSSCVLSGAGRWTGPDEDQRLDLIVATDESHSSCESGTYSYLEVVGHSTPYGLYWVLGDPDSGTGIWFKRQ